MLFFANTSDKVACTSFLVKSDLKVGLKDNDFILFVWADECEIRNLKNEVLARNEVENSLLLYSFLSPSFSPSHFSFFSIPFNQFY